MWTLGLAEDGLLIGGLFVLGSVRFATNDQDSHDRAEGCLMQWREGL